MKFREKSKTDYQVTLNAVYQERWHVLRKISILRTFILEMCKTSRPLFFCFGDIQLLITSIDTALWSMTRSRIITFAKIMQRVVWRCSRFKDVRVFSTRKGIWFLGGVWAMYGAIIARRSGNFHGIFSRSDRPIMPVLIVMIWFIRNYSCRCCAHINAVHSCRAGRRTVFIPWIIIWELHAGITREEVVTRGKVSCV